MITERIYRCYECDASGKLTKMPPFLSEMGLRDHERRFHPSEPVGEPVGEEERGG